MQGERCKVKSSRSRTLIFNLGPWAFFLILLLTACGKKGPVRPLELPLPAAPGAFELRQKGDSILLGWTIPTANQDGSPLTDLARFEIYKMRFLPLDDCPECRDTSALWREINLDYLRDARRIDDRLFLWDDDVATGLGYRYRVVPVTERGHHGAPAVAARTIAIPPPSPSQVETSPHDRMARLEWAFPEGEQPVGVFIYRRNQGEPLPLFPVNRQPLTELFFEDFGLENGRTYLYTLRSARRDGDAWTESAPSETVTVTPRTGF